VSPGAKAARLNEKPVSPLKGLNRIEFTNLLLEVPILEHSLKSTHFFISPFPAELWKDPDDPMPKPTSDLRIDPALYRDGLLQRWPEIFIYSPSSTPEYDYLKWELPPESHEYSGLWGVLQRNGQYVEFGTGPDRSFVDFILWHRSFVPPQYPLYLFNWSSWDSLLLNPDVTEDEIVQFTGIIS
jgi:hypothetical protein